LAALAKTDADWAKAAQAKQTSAWVAFYTDDAVILPPDDKPAADKESIRKAIDGMMGLPNLSVNWQTTKTDIANSGDLGYTWGAYDLSFNNPKGKPVSEHGKYLEVWRKQADGSWKCSVDMWSSDAPAK
jgi:ketosteroid isomerase-like protein